MISLSVIIPTYNRSEILQECLLKLSQQTLSASDYEILVINDGSTDDTHNIISRLQIKYELRYFQQPNRGPAAARNKGIKEAKGNILLFFGDDMLAESNLLGKHLVMHKDFDNPKESILGFIDWDPRLHCTSLMRYLNRGPQFAYYRIKNLQDAGFDYFYSSNISLKRNFLLENGLFDEDFKYAACEDTELGYRLEQKGLKIHFCKDAIAYHHHPVLLDDFLKRAELVGRETVLLQKKHPNVFARKNHKLARSLVKSFLPLLTQIARSTSKKDFGIALIYRALFLYYFHKGYQIP